METKKPSVIKKNMSYVTYHDKQPSFQFQQKEANNLMKQSSMKILPKETNTQVKQPSIKIQPKETNNLVKQPSIKIQPKETNNLIKQPSIKIQPKEANKLVNQPSIKAQPREETKQIQYLTTDPFGKTPSHNMKRANSKKQKLPVIDNTKASKESETLKILKKSNSSLEDHILIDKCLQKNLFMRNLEKQARIEVIKQMSYCFVAKNTVIFEQGSIGNYFYILKEGMTSLFIDDLFKKNIGPGESFGDLALLHGATRSGTIKAVEDTYLWCLERKKFKQVIDYIANKNFEENKSFINSIPMFKNMDSNFITRLSMSMISVIYDPGTYIIKDGESSDCMYIIKDGSVVCSKKEKVFRNLSKGDSFGFLSILIDSPRTMNVIAKTNCELYCISVSTLVDLLGPKYKDTLYLNFIKIAMSNSKHFNKINPHLIELAYGSFKPSKYDKNSVVYKKGTAIDEKVVIILEGMLVKNISTTDIASAGDDKKVAVAERGSILFEEHLFSLDVNNRFVLDFDVYADPDCLLMEASLIDFVKLLGGSFHDLTEKSNLIESLSKVPLFKDFSMNKLKSIAEHITIENFKNSQTIIKEGEEGSKFYIVKSGKIDIYRNKNYLRSLNEYEYFGERSLFIQEPRSATAVANGVVSLYVLSKEHFMKIIDENLKQHIIERLSLQDNTIELSDLDYIKDLGSGNFGNVYLVNCRKNNRLYALKTVSKNQIDQEQLHSNLDMERKILLQIDYPFIMKLVKSLKDKEGIYFLMEFIRGKELWDVIREIGLMNKSQTQFYGCSLLIAMDYLHNRKFVYRDIKPENAMVSDKGYVKIIDFGTAKEIEDRTTTIIGTPHYMAPEVILGEGYGFSIDFWSVAICIYEFMCCKVPFGDTCEDPMDIYSAIINEDITFPKFVKDNAFKHAMKSMLKKNLVSRLCTLNQIKTHPWFTDFNWEKLIGLQMTPPYIPKLKNMTMPSKTIPFNQFIVSNRKATTKPQLAEDVQKSYDLWFEQF